MLRPRIIPCLLVKNKGLVKTVKFASPKYVGDPVNAVRIFNEKEVDELMVLDIDATANRAEPDYQMIRDVAAECRMPLCYGGGVTALEQAIRIIKLGVEKIAISASGIANPALVTEMARHVGNQSIVVVLDVRKNAVSDQFEVWTHNGTRFASADPVALAKQAEDRGAGELVINSIDRDGTMSGYDVGLVQQIRQAVSIPISVLGGAGSLRDIGSLIETFGIIGAAAGSLFVFKGVYKAVLINYPGRTQKAALMASAMAGSRA